MDCPFKVGDRVHEIVSLGVWWEQIDGHLYPTTTPRWRLADKPNATVTALTARGFEYRYDYPIPFGRAAWGQTTEGGEVYETGFHMWRKV